MSAKGKHPASGISVSGEFTEKDWDFRDVPTDALIACCYWEYARESARIRAAFDPEDKIFFPNPTPTYVLSPAGQRFKTSSEINTPSMQFFERIRMEALPVLEVFRHAKKEADSPFELPWLKLSVSARQTIIAELSPYFAEKPGLTFLPFNRCSDLRDLGIADEEYRCAERNAELGIERLRVEIDWGGFTDAQIVGAFKAWVGDKNRPPGFGTADHRGRRKKKGYGDYLAWLGIMRLMNICSFTSIENKLPKAWSCYRSADWPRARDKAGRVFRELFHFLPAEEKPIHWKTAGGRAK